MVRSGFPEATWSPASPVVVLKPIERVAACYCVDAPLAASRVNEGAVAGDIPYFDAGPLPVLRLCTPLERRIAERASLAEIESPGEGFLAVTPYEFTKS